MVEESNAASHSDSHSAVRASTLELLTVIVPARDEEGSVAAIVEQLDKKLSENNIPREIVVVDDGSTDGTWRVLEELQSTHPSLRPLRNPAPHGVGRAVALGLDKMRGDCVTIVMADGSDDPNDVIVYWAKLNSGFDCVFGSRFIKGGGTVDYPWLKMRLNRMANLFIRLMFGIRFNDTTNAFKAYRRTVIDGVKPILSPHFNIFVELPLKAIVRGYSWTVVPITWRNRRTGESKLKMKEMGSRYLFICLYVWLEKHLSRGDYVKDS